MALIWKDGKLVVRSSPEMKQYKNMVLRPEAEKKFLHIMADFVGKCDCFRWQIWVLTRLA